MLRIIENLILRRQVINQSFLRHALFCHVCNYSLYIISVNAKNHFLVENHTHTVTYDNRECRKWSLTAFPFLGARA